MQTRTLAVPHGTLAYDDWGGDGPVVLCLPGLGDLRAEYRFLAPRLSAAGFRVLVADLRGHGDSSASFASYRPEDIADDALAILDDAGAARASVIGCSISGGVAALLAARAPERVERIALLCAFVRDAPGSRWIVALGMLLFAWPWGARLWTVYHRWLYRRHRPADLDEHVARLHASLRDPARLRAMRQMFAASKTAVEAALADARAPALVVMGTGDPDFPDPAEEARLTASRLDGRVVPLDGLGHYPHVEDPDAVAAAVVPFLRNGSVRAA